MNRRALGQMLVGAAIAGACLYFFFRNTDVAALWTALKSADYRWLGLVALLGACSMVFRVFRWKYLLYEAKDISFRGLWTPTAIGFMANALLPARAGEAIRVVALAQRERVPIPTVVATLVMDRLFDLLAVVIIGVWAFSILPIDASALEQLSAQFPFTIDEVRRIIGVSMGGSMVVGVVVLNLLYFQRERTERLLRAVLFFLPSRWRERLIDILERFTDGMSILRRPRHVAACLFFTLGTWGTITLTFPVFFYAFHIQDLLPWYAPIIMVACASLAVLVPTPGYLGSYQIGMAVALALTNASIGSERPGMVEAFGIVTWVGTFIPVVLLGLATLAFEGVSLGALQRQAKAETATATEHDDAL